MSTPQDPTGAESPLDRVIADYLQAVEAGQVPNRQEFLARHPDLAEALRTFFADLDRMDRHAGPLRLDVAEEARPTVRYFGDYELLEEIGHGGMGVVYKARQVSLNRTVALKMILAGAFATAREVMRFRAEAEAAANLDHPNIVPIYEVGEHDGQQYFSMKLIEGSLKDEPPAESQRRAAEVVAQAARAVHYAHQRGILHRDVKPSNILIDARGTPYLVDFGLARRMEDAGRSLTETGQIVGTPRYMAPEQASGRKDLTVAADVYALGVVLYERLAGRTPFVGDDPLEILRQVCHDEPPRPSALRRGVDRDLETVALKCLAKEPARRYASAAELADDLERWLRGEPIQARRAGTAERVWRWCQRNPVVAGLLAALVVTLAAGMAASLTFAVQAERRAEGERIERGRADRALKEEAKQRREAERWAASISLDLDLAEKNVRLRVLRLARAVRTMPEHCTELRQAAMMNLLAWGQMLCPLVRLPADSSFLIRGGRYALSTDDEKGNMQLWETLTGRSVANLRAEQEGSDLVDLSDDGHVACTIGRKSGITRLWEVPGGRLRTSIPLPVQQPKELLIRSRLNASGSRVSTTYDSTGPTTLLIRLNADASRVLTLCESPSHVALWDGVSGKLIAHLDHPRLPAAGAAFSPDGSFVATWSKSEVRAWSTKDGRLRAHLTEAATDGVRVAFSPSGRVLGVLGGGSLHWISTRDGKPVSPPSQAERAEYLRLLTDELAIFHSPVEKRGWPVDRQLKVIRRGKIAPLFVLGTPVTWFGYRRAMRVRGNLVLTPEMMLFDLASGSWLSPPTGSRFHPDTKLFADEGRYVLSGTGGAQLIDLASEKAVGPTCFSYTRVSATGCGYVGKTRSRRDGIDEGWRLELVLDDSVDLFLHLPAPTLDLPADALELWARLVARGELGPNGEFVKWDEPTWQRHRKRLAAWPLPRSEFPFPGLIVNDPGYWARKAD